MIEIRVGTLHEAEADAILRPVSSALEGVTAAGREVDLRVGEAVRSRLEVLGSLPVGGAVVTPGGDIPVTFLIHVSVQSPDEPVTAAGISRGLLNGLRRASEWEIDSLAMPPLGTGAGNLDAERSASLMAPLLLTHLATMSHPSTITIVVPGPYEEEIFTLALAGPLESVKPAESAEPTGGDQEPVK